jgi:AraC family transcriptional regulator
VENPNITIEYFTTRVIYVRFKGSYVAFRKNGRKMFNQLFSFATEHNLVIPGETKVLTIYHDNPFITDAENLRTSVAMTIPNDVVINEIEEINVMNINGKYGVGHFEISAMEYEAAWQYMYQEWLFKGEEKPRDSFPFELYVSEPPKRLKEKSFTDIYIPIE